MKPKYITNQEVKKLIIKNNKYLKKKIDKVVGELDLLQRFIKERLR